MTHKTPQFTIRFQGTPGAVRRALTQIRSELEAAGTEGAQMGKIETVMAEVLNNVVEHALENSGKGMVEALGRQEAKHWVFEVWDTGLPLPRQKLPPKDFPPLDTALEDLPEGGFGWAMVHLLTSSISYQRQSGRNCLTFTMPNS